MKLDLLERTMLVFLFFWFFLLPADPARIPGATASGRGCPVPARRGACPWSPPRRRGTALSATTTPPGTTTGSGPVRAAKPSSKGVFKVTNSSSESPLLLRKLTGLEIPAWVWDNDICWVFLSTCCALPHGFTSVLLLAGNKICCYLVHH